MARAGFINRFLALFGVQGKTGGYVVVALSAALLLMVLTVRFNIQRHWEGLFLLKGNHGYLFEIKDDLYLGDGSRLIISLDPEAIEYVRHLRYRLNRKSPDEAHLEYTWFDRDGCGYVRNYLPGGKQLLTCFSRFKDDDGVRPKGLFVGGGLPRDVEGDDVLKLSGTGMAYYNGKRWYHIWCNVNEGLASGTTIKNVVPSSWKFLGSGVINEGYRELAITSSHIAIVDGVPLRIDRYAYFRAGETYFILSIFIINIGDRPTSYFYCYGDEPWLGDFGTSKGNVGWVKDKIIDYEQWVDNRKYDYAGLFDYGNDAIGEGHDFTMAANFLQWMGDDVPAVYFSNGSTQVPREAQKVPLSGDSRFLGLQWGPQELKPGQHETYVLAIGMAPFNPKTGMPEKPEIKIPNTCCR